MTAHYDLYEALGLDRGADCAALGAEINSRLQGLHARGVPAEAPEVQQLLAAGSILGEEGRRASYDTRLGDESAPTMDIPALRTLAATGSFPDEEETVAGSRPAGAPSPADEAGTAAFGAAADAGPRPGAPAPPPTPQQAAYPAQPAQPQPAFQATPQPQQPGGYPPAYAAPVAPAAPSALSRLLAPVPTAGRVLLGAAATIVVVGALGLIGVLIAVLSALSDSGSDSLVDELFSGIGQVIVAVIAWPLAALFLLAVVIGTGILARALGERTPLTRPAVAVPAIGLALAALVPCLLRFSGWLLTAGLLLLIASVVVAVLAFVGDSGTWLAGRPVAPRPAPAPVAPQGQYGQFGQPGQPAPGDAPHGQGGGYWTN